VAARSAGIPGIGVMLASVGGFLVFAGIQDVGLTDGLRSLLSGKVPTGKAATVTAVPGYLTGSGAVANAAAAVGGGASSGAGGLGDRIATEGQAHLGVPYVWGGNTPAGWDCSGFVTWVLTTVGVTGLPSATHTTAAQFLVWKGALTVSRSTTQRGDLCCWAGHIGIAVDGSNMVNAPTFGIPTRVQPIYAGVTIRRIVGF
jgi:cell wall-associated NlpC family hydrolase